MLGKALLFVTVLIALSGVTIVALSISNVNSSKQVNQQLYQSVSNPISVQAAAKDLNLVSAHSSKSTLKIHGSRGHVLSVSTVKKLAKKFIKQRGASPGTPKLVKYDGRKVYIVPVIQNRKKVGEIDIDAKNGKNLGGAGGAP